MGKLLALALVLGGLAAAVAFVPVRGLTVLDRWALAPDTSTFVARGYAELKDAFSRAAAHRPDRVAAAHRTARPQARELTPAPQEHHTDADRAALDRIVAQSARK